MEMKPKINYTYVSFIKEFKQLFFLLWPAFEWIFKTGLFVGFKNHIPVLNTMVKTYDTTSDKQECS